MSSPPRQLLSLDCQPRPPHAYIAVITEHHHQVEMKAIVTKIRTNNTFIYKMYKLSFILYIVVSCEA